MTKKQKKIDYKWFSKLSDLADFLNKIGKERIVQIIPDKTYFLDKWECGGYKLGEDERWIVFYEK